MEQEGQGACAKKEGGSVLPKEIQETPSPKKELCESTENTTSLNPGSVQGRPPLKRKYKRRRYTSFSRKPNSRRNRKEKREKSKVSESKTEIIKNTMKQIDTATKTGDNPKTTLPKLESIDRIGHDEGTGEKVPNKGDGQNIEVTKVPAALPSPDAGTSQHTTSPSVIENKSDQDVPTGAEKSPDEISKSDLDAKPSVKSNSPNGDSRTFNQKILELCQEIEKSRLDLPKSRNGGGRTDTVDTGPSTSGMKNANDQDKNKPGRKKYKPKKRDDGEVPRYYDASLESKMNHLKNIIAEIDALLFQEIGRKNKYIRRGYKLTHSVLKFLEKKEKEKGKK